MYNPFDPDALTDARIMLFDLEIQRNVVRSITVRAGYNDRRPSTDVMIAPANSDNATESEIETIVDIFSRYAPTTRYNAEDLGCGECCVVHEHTHDGVTPTGITLRAYAKPGSDLAVALLFPVGKGEEPNFTDTDDDDIRF